MTGDEWALAQEGRNLGLVWISAGDGWEAELTDARGASARLGPVTPARGGEGRAGTG